MTPLVQRDYIANRMGEGGTGISYTEFSYTILQGYDFWHLFKKYGVELQLAGADQWGNSLSGVDYIRRVEGKEAHVMTCPLIINKATGKKFGKSEDGAVWLDANQASGYKFYQFWLNSDDEGVEDYLKVYTELGKPAVDKIMDEFKKNRSERSAQKALAYEVTKLVHGKDAADAQMEIANKLFGRGKLELNDREFKSVESEFPTAKVSRGMDSNELFTALIDTGLASSKSEARRFYDEGSVYINNVKITSGGKSLFPLSSGTKHAIIRRGKNSIALLKIK